MAQEFKIGDRVKTYFGVGTVVSINHNGVVGVEHDNHHPDFHTLGGACDMGRGYWYYDYQLILVPAHKQELHFVRKGNVVHAIFKDGDKITRAKATCSPEDEFNFLTGVELAKARVFDCETKNNKPAPIKVEKYKRYILKPYDEVTLHHGISKTDWEDIKWGMAVEEVNPSYDTLHIIDNKNRRWWVTLYDILREANPDE